MKRQRSTPLNIKQIIDAIVNGDDLLDRLFRFKLGADKRSALSVCIHPDVTLEVGTCEYINRKKENEEDVLLLCPEQYQHLREIKPLVLSIRLAQLRHINRNYRDGHVCFDDTEKLK
jgi:hypothetical protein